MKYIRTEYGEIFDLKTTSTSLFVIRDKTKKDEKNYFSYRWDNWKNYFFTGEQNCALFSYDAALNLISKLVLEGLNYNDLVVELHPDFKKYKQADTIEELCDCFVAVGKKHYVWDKQHCTSITLEQMQSYPISDFEIYGAIWTNEGLIYVAKINEKGDCELL